MRTVTFLAILLVQMSPTKPCSFIRMTGEFLAAVKFSVGMDSEDLCATARLTFARNPQLHCTSVPVFTRTGHRRLFFGDVYNTTGYIFMNAYAFTSKCACESRACCGIKKIREYLVQNRTYTYYMPGSDAALTDVNQIFFIARAVSS
ncbi:hypothetical protein OESDEN_16168 [Oesophagostomum dentatum]|uniref:Uncharacterized protein n=1 Tax=Oesophagostomum dentatum TaxID=61180 RepID=A0A0B1SKW4_OESDE|nr:hypothetical protein OESDEN_16168 [Oesophagostomum dentatum]